MDVVPPTGGSGACQHSVSMDAHRQAESSEAVRPKDDSAQTVDLRKDCSVESTERDG